MVVIAFEFKLPISRAEFERGRAIEPLEPAIIAFLKANHKHTYASKEIYTALFTPKVFDPFNPKTIEEIARIERILDTLMGKNAILGRGTGSPDEIYYSVA